MFKKVIFMFCFIILICSVSVSCSYTDKKNKNVSQIFKSQKLNQEDEVSYTSMTKDELEEAMTKQPIKILRTEHYVSSILNSKGVPQNYLTSVIQNNSGVRIKDVVIGFVAWDDKNLPIKIKSDDMFYIPSYLTKVNYNDINLEDGYSYGQNIGAAVENNEIVNLKSIVISYTDYDGNTWKNDLMKEFENLYLNKKFVE